MDVHILDWKDLDLISNKKWRVAYLVITTAAGTYALPLKKKEANILGKLLIKHSKLLAKH